MDYRRTLNDLEDAARQLHDGINAIGLMTMGLVEAIDPYADGFNAIWNYLVEAEQNLQEHIKRCREAE